MELLPLFFSFYFKVFPYLWDDVCVCRGVCLLRGMFKKLICSLLFFKPYVNPCKIGAGWFCLILSVLKILRNPVLLAKVLMRVKKRRGSWQEKWIPPSPKQNKTKKPDLLHFLPFSIIQIVQFQCSSLHLPPLVPQESYSVISSRKMICINQFLFMIGFRKSEL